MVRLDPDTLLAFIKVFEAKTLHNAKSKKCEKEYNTIEESTENIENKIQTKQQPQKEKIDKHLYERLSHITHLHLQRKEITHLDYIKLCKKCQFIFLQENQLKKIGQLKHLHRLKEIYLHDNILIRLEGLSNLRCLEKFYAPRNRLSVIEGLPCTLKELDVSYQKLSSKGESLLLDPQALIQMQNSLTLLDISGNNIKEINAIGLLTALQVLRASHNALKCLRDVVKVISKINLVELDFRSNPLVKVRHYWRKILSSSPYLKILDDRTIAEENIRWAKYEESYIKQQSRLEKPITHELESQLHFVDKSFLFTSPAKTKTQQNGYFVGNSSGYILGSLKREDFLCTMQKILNNDSVDTEIFNQKKNGVSSIDNLSITAQSVNNMQLGIRKKS